MASTAALIALWVVALPVALASAYLLLLAIASRRPRARAAQPPHLRLAVVIPAHDEEAGIADTVRSVLSVEYPPALWRLVVVADNCSDATGERAQRAGAEVWSRRDDQRRGKGFALAFAFERILASGDSDGVVVVDADTVVSPNLLAVFAAGLEDGALALQARYAVRDPDRSWRTLLMSVALSLFNDVRSLGRERLGCSAGLRGNGMCFATGLLREVPSAAYSIVEDLEYGVRLGLAGHRVHYAWEASVYGDMPTGQEAARVQRRRWESGRWRIARSLAPSLLRRGIRSRDRVLLDLGLDLVVPPLAYLGGAALAGLGASLALRGAGGAPHAAIPWAASVVALGVYVARGWWVSGTGARGLLALARAPAYLAWKLGLVLQRAPPGDSWVRTPRERGP